MPLWSAALPFFDRARSSEGCTHPQAGRAGVDKTLIENDDLRTRLERIEKAQAGKCFDKEKRGSAFATFPDVTKKLTWLLIKESFVEKLPMHGLFR